MNTTRPPSILRIAARISNAFVLDLVKLGMHRRDVIDPLLRTALLQANEGHMIRDPELRRRYATLDDDVPDNLRRPASINAIATSLGIPFETARRRIGAMAEAGICIITANGVIVSSAATNAPAYRTACAVQFEKLHNLYGRLRAIEFLEAPRPPSIPFDPSNPPYRLAGRIVVEYVLRFTEPITRHIRDVVTGLTLMELILANTEELDGGLVSAEDLGSEGVLADSFRKPVSITALGRRLDIPHETTRRHVQRLLDRGLCVKVHGGYIVPAEALARPPFMQMWLDNQIHLNRLFQSLDEFGVLAIWEQGQQVDAA
jgi:DNA-binding Lrp family transcriptional regulator